MCRRTTCDQCGRPTWAGCGAHIEQALAGVPADQRCRCREQEASGPAKAPPAKKRFWFFG